MNKEYIKEYIKECEQLELAANSFPFGDVGSIEVLYGNFKEVRINIKNKKIVVNNDNLDNLEFLIDIAIRTQIKYNQIKEKYKVVWYES